MKTDEEKILKIRRMYAKGLSKSDIHTFTDDITVNEINEALKDVPRRKAWGRSSIL